jgi:isopenicillin N synthase-like dioxygenase
MEKLPVIDISPLIQGGNVNEVAKQINQACTQYGFFYIKGHGFSTELQQELEKLSEQFFALPESQKKEISMDKGGRAWRGFFPVKGELTSGKPDLKEGIYFGEELSQDHPKVKGNVAMHGQNIFPDEFPELKPVVLAYMQKLTELGHHLMRGISLSLGLAEDYFNTHFTHNPLILFRIFHYPPTTIETKQVAPWGVGEHTDYGVFTILKQDEVGGLQVKSNDQWINAPYIKDTFVCNIGDMLDKLTGGYYISTPHRVLNETGKERYSFPFFFDPNFDAQMKNIGLSHLPNATTKQVKRWDNTNLHEFKGTYGEYILNKVSKVFPEL